MSRPKSQLLPEAERVRWYGDAGDYLWSLRCWALRDQEMTAISMLYTDAGFVIAADGRCRSDDPSATTERETDEAQKIFIVENEQVKMAWALTGFASNETGTFDLIVKSKEQVGALSATPFPYGYDYIEKLCSNIKKVVGRGIHDGQITQFPKNEHLSPEEKDRIFKVYFLGYFRESPFWIESSFYRKDGIKTRISTLPTHYSNLNCVGPESVSSMMYEDTVTPDPRLARYKRAITDGELEYTISFIRACCDPAAKEIDTRCERIGGHIHAAEVTRSSARWLIAPCGG